MEAYLDNAATTRVSDAVYKKMSDVFLKDYGNPSSMHTIGMRAENYVKESREIISRILKCEPSEIIFTSGGTESNNFALIGAALAYERTGKHIITTKIEHASVYNPILFLESRGFSVDFADVDEKAVVDIDGLCKMIKPDTSVVSVMMVNNEVGSINDISEISRKIKEINPDIIFHVDAIQAFGKMEINPRKMGIDLLSVSGHKIHGPKGSGFLYVRKGVKLKPIIYGGGQEKGMRSGTENVPAIAGLGTAAKEMYDELGKNREHLYELKKRLIEGVKDMEDVRIHTFYDTKIKEHKISDDEIKKTAPHIVSIGFKGVRSEVLLHALEDKQVYVSSGSACSSNHPAISGTLSAMLVPKDYLDSTVRFSFCKYTTDEEIEYALEVLHEIVPVLKKYRRH